MKLFSHFLITLSGLVAVSVQAQEMDFAHIETTGYGEVIATPDMAEFTVQVVESTQTAEQAKQSVDSVVTAFIQRLKEAGISREDIVSGNLSLAPRYHYPKNGKQELVGYQASRRVTVQVYDLSKLNRLLDGALGDGINRVDNIALKVKDQEKYKQAARMAAIKDAKQKAQSLAKGFERELDGVWKIRYDRMPPQPVLMRSMAMEAAMDNSAGYQDSTIEIRDQVSVIYRLK